LTQSGGVEDAEELLMIKLNSQIKRYVMNADLKLGGIK
jgi:hypothetical protein